MRDLAGTVTDAPPLRLTADATGLAPALPGYYVALRPVSGRAGAPDGLVVGDTRTGKTVAVIAPPAGTTFTSVSGAADDRTFAVIAGPISGNSFFDSFYLLTIAPGSSPATRLTRLPVGPLTGVVVAAALSASGKELAVAMGGGFFPGGANRDLVVYSVTTGDAVEDWSTPDTTVIVPSSVVPDDNLLQFTQYPALSWIDGDRAIAFPQLAKTGALYSFDVRSISVATGGGDLMAYSKVIADLGGSQKSTGPCGTAFPVLSGNGTTAFCLASNGPDGHTNPATVRWVLEWRPVQTPLANGAEWRSFPYPKVIGVPAGSSVQPATVWASSTGATLLIEWSVVTPGHRVPSVRFGRLSLGENGWTFTSLPAPAIFAAGGGAPGIAW
jgi:hypothetical protein